MLKTNTLYHGDCLDLMMSLPDNSIDLVLCSPPYEDCRTYGMGFNLTGQNWVDWLICRVHQMSRVCKGLVAIVVEGKTKNYRWSATPALLMADLHRAGLKLRKPPAYRRVGIPGSGGPDWLRNDYEFIVCLSKGKLPWSDNTAMGSAPKYDVGGELSYRHKDGQRRNALKRPTWRDRSRRENGQRRSKLYAQPEKANPGNVIDCSVGGGKMGSNLAHETEAPYPEQLCELFIRSFCPPNGVVLDPFIGSGTTAAVALRHGRRYIGMDIRKSQISLTRRRLKGVLSPKTLAGFS